MPRPRTGGAVFRAGRWYARITLSREPTGADGRKPRLEEPVRRAGQPLTTESRADEAHARRFARRLQELYDEGSWEPTGRTPVPAPTTKETTVAVWCERWLETQAYSNAVKDQRTAKAALLLRSPAGWCFGDLAVSKVTPKDVAAWLSVLRATPVAGGAPRAPRTVRNALDPVARALRAAVFEGLLGQDPCAVLPTEHRPQAVDADPLAQVGRRLSRVDVETLLGEPGIEPRWSAVWHLLALTGAREAEVIALRWCDLLPDEPLPRVQLATQIHHRTRTREPTKTRAVKQVPLHPVLRAELEAWAREGWPAEYGRAPTSEDLIVPARGKPGRFAGVEAGVGGPLWQQTIHRALQRDLAACGLPPHRVHDLRHTFVSLCADAGIAADVATRWTHAPTSTSARHLYLVPSWDRQCAEMLRLQVTPRRGPSTRHPGTAPVALPVAVGLGERFG